MISVIVSIKNRALLLKHGGLQGLLEQDYIKDGGTYELNVIDDLSADDLDYVLSDVSKNGGFEIVNKYSVDTKKGKYFRGFNCPALDYNLGVKVSTSDYIIKIDPEATIITRTFVSRSLDICRRNNSKSIIMPLPHHCFEFELGNIDNIRRRYKYFEYSTHINKENAHSTNVYYACLFNRQSYIDLGGIDIRFLRHIGSEDDHFLLQWRRKYGDPNVITLLDEDVLHLWHGGFSKGVPPHLYTHVDANNQLKILLSGTYPNDGDFNQVVYPDNILLTRWIKGTKEFKGCVSL
jgi:hypothetical protein